MTPFEKAGYTKDTKFKVICGYGPFYEGDILVLDEDDNSDYPRFRKVGTDVAEYMNLPGNDHEELEVYEEQEEGVEETPAPVTRNTKINVELTVEEALGVVIVLDSLIGGELHREVTNKVGDKLDEKLEELGIDTYYAPFYELVTTSLDEVNTGSFDTLLDALFPPSTERQDNLKEIEELRNRLAELEAKVEGMD